jgi:hypothetical protein
LTGGVVLGVAALGGAEGTSGGELAAVAVLATGGGALTVVVVAAIGEVGTVEAVSGTGRRVGVGCVLAQPRTPALASTAATIPTRTSIGARLFAALPARSLGGVGRVMALTVSGPSAPSAVPPRAVSLSALGSGAAAAFEAACARGTAATGPAAAGAVGAEPRGGGARAGAAMGDTAVGADVGGAGMRGGQLRWVVVGGCGGSGSVPPRPTAGTARACSTMTTRRDGCGGSVAAGVIGRAGT